ncbi:hypothetical protein FB451DRAFT_1165126 [Mycena latifolia]|nr:hypothetical protein FB451DRAFT_1165126 [Mycena latifolia]
MFEGENTSAHARACEKPGARGRSRPSGSDSLVLHKLGAKHWWAGEWAGFGRGTQRRGTTRSTTPEIFGARDRRGKEGGWQKLKGERENRFTAVRRGVYYATRYRFAKAGHKVALFIMFDNHHLTSGFDSAAADVASPREPLYGPAVINCQNITSLLQVRMESCHARSRVRHDLILEHSEEIGHGTGEGRDVDLYRLTSTASARKTSRKKKQAAIQRESEVGKILNGLYRHPTGLKVFQGHNLFSAPEQRRKREPHAVQTRCKPVNTLRYFERLETGSRPPRQRLRTGCNPTQADNPTQSVPSDLPFVRHREVPVKGVSRVLDQPAESGPSGNGARRRGVRAGEDGGVVCEDPRCVGRLGRTSTIIGDTAEKEYMAAFVL